MSVLEALWLQSQLAERPIQQVLQGDWSVGDLRRHGAATPTVLASHGKREAGEWSLSITFGTPNGSFADGQLEPK